MVPTLTTSILLLGLMLAPAAFGQAPAAPASKPAEAQAAREDALGRDTPRGTVLGFIKAAEADNLVRAAQYLDTRQPAARTEQLARELKRVLDRRLSPADLDTLGEEPGGNRHDDLRPDLDRVGTVESASGPVDIMLARVRRGDQQIWLFSGATLQAHPVGLRRHPAPVDRAGVAARPSGKTELRSASARTTIPARANRSPSSWTSRPVRDSSSASSRSRPPASRWAPRCSASPSATEPTS